MPTAQRRESQAPIPDRTPEQSRQANGGTQGAKGRPSFVPGHIQRHQQTRGHGPMPGQMPSGAGQPSAQLMQRGSTRHQPRGLGGALQQGNYQSQRGRARTTQAGGGAAASYTGNVLGQFSANYPNDAWFFDGNLGQWLQLDPTYESAVMLMNEVVSLARAHMLPLYYDTDDNTGMVVDVYAF
jgi:hypothetical protein